MLKKMFVIIALGSLAIGCSTFKLEPADFAWALENELTPAKDGLVVEQRHSIKFNVTNMFKNEYGDKFSGAFSPIRIIRSSKGYYFMTAENFKNIYVFESDDSAFELFKVIEIDSAGIEKPAFNQRKPFIELLYNSDKKILLNEKGINGGAK